MAGGGSSFGAQANALLRKNLTYQKRNICENVRLVLLPAILCILLVGLQTLVNKLVDTPDNRCGCSSIDKGNGQNETVCGIEYSDKIQALFCPIPNPPEWPSVLQVPYYEYRSIRTDSTSFTDFPDDSCRDTGSCPASFLFTGKNQTFGNSLAEMIFPSSIYINPSDISYSLAKNVLGSVESMEVANFFDPAFVSNAPLYYLQPKCTTNSTRSIPIKFDSMAKSKEFECVEGRMVWRNSSAEINDEIFKGYQGKANEIVGAYDFLNSNFNNFNVSVFHNASYKRDRGDPRIQLTRVPRAVNLISNAYLQMLCGPSVEMLLEFVKEMPKPITAFSLDLTSAIGPLFFTWVILQLFPVILTSLVYEKQHKLRIMMKMHGLGDGPYWMITYGYFLLVSAAYMLCFVLFGSVIGLKFFSINDYSIQFVFYFIYINLQIALAFLIAAMFSNAKTAAVVGYILVFGTGLLGAFLFSLFVEDPTFSRGWIIVMELYPGFSLYRGLLGFSYYAVGGSYTGTPGISWIDLRDGDNGFTEVLVLMSVEWVVFLFVAYYLDQVKSSGSGVGRSPLFFLKRFRKKPIPFPSRKPVSESHGSKVLVEMDNPDVAQEREKVEQLLFDPSDHAIVCDNLKKVYPRRDGNPEKYAVRGMSLAVPQGECFGMLGPNGAGKTSFINMMIGLTEPSSGAAYVHGLNIRTQMNEVYTNMGVCPQHDLLWENLTGREHLLFYGRLKNLKGSELTRAVEESLNSVNLTGAVANKQVRKYSGGMKRRLSVAISLIGDPKVVYMDEPSTGLDPASRYSLRNVVKRAKQNRAIILTTHSMEEAEALCDRLGIFMDGDLQCIGNAKELKARYGGSYVFTMTTSSEHEEKVDMLVRSLSPNANKVYHLSGTQKFELPKQDIRIANVFQAVEKAKTEFAVYAWGLADTTLEDVFIKVAQGAQSSSILS